MKCKIFLLMVLSFFVLSLHAQNQPDLDELIARSKITTFKSIHEVFTSQELAMLRAHYHGDDVDSNAIQMGGEVAYGPESQTGHFGTFSIADPSTFDMISTSPANNFEGAGAVSDDGQEAYAIDGIIIFLVLI